MEYDVYVCLCGHVCVCVYERGRPPVARGPPGGISASELAFDHAAEKITFLAVFQE